MKKDKWIAVLSAGLFIALLAALFMGGIITGRSMGASHGIASGVIAQDQQLRESLSEADKQILKQAMDMNRTKITKLHADLEDIKKDIKSIIKPAHFDKKALNAILEAEKDKKLALLQLIQETRETAMKKMSPEGRDVLSKM